MSDFIIESESQAKAVATLKTSLDKITKVEEERAKQEQESEPAIPLVDRHGRSRWIHTRTCYCLPNEDECRQHSAKEPGWESCPNEKFRNHRTARKLWGFNPEFGKPMPEEEVVEVQPEGPKDEVRIECEAEV